jgi:hypothetical protein
VGHLISWTHIDPKTPEELILFLSDKEIETKEGQQLIIDCGDGADILGHGALCSYYGLNGNHFPHLEKTNLYDADGFPQKIIDAVRNGKMDNIMRYAPAEQLFRMLTPECQIIKQKETPVIEKPTNYESDLFLPGVPCRTREQVLTKLDVIKRTDRTFLHGTGIDCTWSHKRNIGNILAHFRWTDTADGYRYWVEVSRTILVNTYNPSNDAQPEKTIRKTYENFLNLWKDNNNRIDCWKQQEEKEAPKTKSKCVKKTA